MSRTIASLLTADELESYIDNNKDMFDWFETDDDEEPIPDEKVDAIIKDIVEDTKNGKLEYMLYDLFDSWIGEQFNDMVYSCIDGYVEKEVRARI